MNERSAEILVYSEDSKTRGELLGKARQTADKLRGQVSLLLLGPDDAIDVDKWTSSGVDVVYTVKNERLRGLHPEAYTDAVAGVLAQVRVGLSLVGATKHGLEVAPRVAERTRAGYAAWAVDFEIQPDHGAIRVDAMLYTGMGRVTYRFASRPVLLTVAPGTFSPVELGDRQANVRPVEVEIREPRMKIDVLKEKGKSTTGLEDAMVVIDVGQGVKEKVDLAMIDELARMLEALVGCTRPVASERDWFDDWLGLSGKKISADLCMSVGVSGAIQHMIGIRNSRLIVAVNNDEGAAIFTQADYGVVADLYQFLPAFMERLRARSIRPVQG